MKIEYINLKENNNYLSIDPGLNNHLSVFITNNITIYTNKNTLY